MADKFTAPAIGPEDAEFGAFSFFFWESSVDVYDYVLQRGNAIQQQAEKDKKIYNLLVLQTANNERAREFLMDDKAQLLAAGATLDRMTAFQRLENHFIPKITEAKSAAVKALSDAIDSCWGAEQTGVAAGLVKRQAAVRECGYLNCKPDEVIMITQFPKAIPDDERWGAKKSLWQEANIATIKDAIEKARVADMQIGSENTAVPNFLPQSHSEKSQEVSWRGVPVQEQTARRTQT